MAYTSDFRLKNLLKDIHLEVLDDLLNQSIIDLPDLRIFDESNEDSHLFTDGGLMFKDPLSEIPYGSNDAAWIYDDQPIIVIEGTYGTERGQFGDGQLNRFSHSTGVAVNGFIGITITPFEGESYSRTGSTPENLDKSIRLKKAHVHKGFIQGAINVSKAEKGYFLVVDAYDVGKIKALIIEATKQRLGLQNKLNQEIKSTLKNMQSLISNWVYGAQSVQLLTNLYGKSGKNLSHFSRSYTHNFAALTTSSKRDGHGLFGKCLVESYLSGKEKYFAIFLRLSQQNINDLNKRQQKEWKFISHSPHITVQCLDDLYFSDISLKRRVKEIMKVNLFQNRQNELFKEVKKCFENGEITLNDY